MQHSRKCPSVQTLIYCAALQVMSAARKLSLTAAVRAIRKMLHRDMKKISIVAILSKSVCIAVAGIVVPGAIVYALLHCCGSRLKGIPAVKLVIEAPRSAVAVILLPTNMACHMAGKLAHGAGEHARPHTSRPLQTHDLGDLPASSTPVVHVAGLVSNSWPMLPPVLPMSSQCIAWSVCHEMLVDGGLVTCSTKQASSARAGLAEDIPHVLR